RYELGVLPSGALLVGLRARDVSGPAGGAGLAIDLRLPLGATVGVGARYATRGNPDARLHRVAIDIVGGYAWRRGAYELRTVVGFVVEPWWVDSRGAALRHPQTATGARPGPLLGGVLGVSQGWLWRARPEANTALRLGMRAQLQAGALAPGGIGRIRSVRDDVIQEVARIGGVELSLGVDAQLWFTLRSRSTTRDDRPRGRAHSKPSSPPSSSPPSSSPPSS
ncbi:MAG: hypothetical protein IAG13_21510, partial [Deltaproteobacteria bacterium]|nr:hypothetical protein [Nannocystaceae bacterium]